MPEWTSTGNILHPDSDSADVAMGGSTSSAPFFFDADHAGVGALAFASKSRLYMSGGDFFHPVNARFELEDSSWYWKRDVSGQHAWLLRFHVASNIPYDEIGGIGWYRWHKDDGATTGWPGSWKAGLILTAECNLVMGGMNFEVDGYAAAGPYGRVTHANDAYAQLTIMQRNSWYGASDLWDRDEAQVSSAYGTDGDGDWFWWQYPAGSARPWNTYSGGALGRQWTEYGRLHISGSEMGRLDVFRRTNETASGQASFVAQHVSEQETIYDGFGAGYGFAIQKKNADPSIVAAIYAVQDGAYNTGKLSFHVASAGSLAERMSLTAAGRLVLGSGAALRRFNVYDTAAAVAHFASSNSLGTRLDIQTNSGSAASNAVLLVRNPDATGAAWEVGLNSAAAAPLTNAFCWSLSAGVTFSAIRMSLSTAGVLNVTGSYQVAGNQVVGARQSAIANISDTSGGAHDGTCRDKVNEILGMLRAHGLIAS